MACIEWEDDDGATFRPLPEFLEAVDALQGALVPFLKTRPKAGPHAERLAEFREERKRIAGDFAGFRARAGKAPTQWERTPDTAAGLGKLVERFAPLAETSHELAVQADRLYKLAVSLVETCEKEYDARSSDTWNGRDITRARKAAEEVRQDPHEARRIVVGARLGTTPKGPLLLAPSPLAHRALPRRGAARRRRAGEAGGPRRNRGQRLELDPGAATWGVAPESEDEDFDFAEAMRAIHAELEEFDAEAATLAATIRKNFEALGI